jgi:hypothetical protein
MKRIVPQHNYIGLVVSAIKKATRFLVALLPVQEIKVFILVIGTTIREILVILHQQ